MQRKRSLGCAHRFRPTYAWANVGHPSLPSMTHSDPETDSYLATGFRDVDTAAVDKMARCLAYMDSLPGFQKYKAAVLEMMKLQRGSITADLGCGLGYDVQRLSDMVGSTGRAIGVDSSMAFLRSANEAFSGADFIQADIQCLPFGGGVLDACKIDRTLQHVEQPAAVLNEIFRTVRSGGAVVCAEPDWGTFVIDDAADPVARQIAQVWREGFRNPHIGRELRERLEEAGFVDLQVQEAALSTIGFASCDMVFDIAQSATQLAERSGSEEPLEWLATLRDRCDPVCCSVTLMINFAKKP
jgi:ubiquinone/menaquinone biosynthesis C-methylase UbiE